MSSLCPSEVLLPYLFYVICPVQLFHTGQKCFQAWVWWCQNWVEWETTSDIGHWFRGQGSLKLLILVFSLSWFGFPPQELSNVLYNQNLLKTRSADKTLYLTANWDIAESKILHMKGQWHRRKYQVRGCGRHGHNFTRHHNRSIRASVRTLFRRVHCIR